MFLIPQSLQAGSQNMFWLEWTRLCAGAKAATVVLILTAALLLGETAAVVHGECHSDGDCSCAICLLAMSPSSVPEAAPQVLPAPATQLRSVLPSVSLPSCRPVFAGEIATLSGAYVGDVVTVVVTGYLQDALGIEDSGSLDEHAEDDAHLHDAEPLHDHEH